MTSREIYAAIHVAALCVEPNTSDRALIAMRDLIVEFIDATAKGPPDSMRAMTIDQIRLLNQLHLAVGQ